MNARTLRHASPAPQEHQESTLSQPDQADLTPAESDRAPKWNVSVYVPGSVKQQLQREKERTGMPYTAVLASAFDRVDPQRLHAWLHPALREPHPQLDDARQRMPQSPNWRRAGGGEQLQLRMSTQQRQWLDQQAAYYNAPSRSALVAGVLQLGLPTD